EYLRLRGVGVIHGGAHSLRYTPHFAIGDEEVELVLRATREALLEGPGSRQKAAAESEAA
ncbi:MAG TPA: hypothetical protein VFX38_00650, partial [Gammaproteobacteria bacterium]|nr:hypothetical protein [Gammaproteobacteria bacterium]